MPLYDYKCAEHGVFHELVEMVNFDKPCECPQCGALSPRIILLPPEFLAMEKDRRQAFETNERAQHEPVFSNREIRDEAHKQPHAPGCGCHHQKQKPSKLFYTATGDKMFPSMRPWMISH